MYLILIAIVVVFDQITKRLILTNMDVNNSIAIWDGIFHITYIQNRGAAFSILQEKTSFLIIMQIIVILVIGAYIIKKRKSEGKVLLYGLSLIMAGGFGNLTDRIVYGYVVDFLDFRIWPIFNVADISVCVGCGLLVLYVFILETKNKKKLNSPND